MKYFKHIRTGSTISSNTFYSLPSSIQSQYTEINNNQNSDFLTSAIVGSVTDSALLGGIIGGSFLGGAVGDLLDGDLFD